MEDKIVRNVVAGFAALVAIVAFFSSYTVVQPGYTGVLFNKATGQMHTVGQGMAFKVPFVTTVQSYPTALRTYTMVERGKEGSSEADDSVDLPTLEGQHIRQDVSVTYNTSEAKAADVFRSFRGQDIEDIENSFIRRTIITVAQNAAGQMSLSEVISAKRGDLQATIQKNLAAEMQKMGFDLDKVNMGASHLPASIEAQMQKKMAAQQEAQQAEYEMQKQTTLAKAAVAQAHGEADSRLIRAKADAESNELIQRTITPGLINLRSVEKWNGVLPQITSGSVPIINLGNLGKAKE